jgi:hypothetical protein
LHQMSIHSATDHSGNFLQISFYLQLLIKVMKMVFKFTRMQYVLICACGENS